MNTEALQHGVVKWFNWTKGYGFITNDQGGKDVFIHRNQLEKAGINVFEEGQKVSFIITQDQRGKESASNIKLLS